MSERLGAAPELDSLFFRLVGPHIPHIPPTYGGLHTYNLPRQSLEAKLEALICFEVGMQRYFGSHTGIFKGRFPIEVVGIL